MLTFSKLLPSEKKEDKIATFVPLLHLDTREKITLDQPQAFGEIYILLFKRLEAQVQELEKETEAFEFEETDKRLKSPEESAESETSS